MGFLDSWKRSKLLPGLADDVDSLCRSFKATVRHSDMPDRIREYLEQHAVAKLQIGAGPTDTPGWLNTDLTPRSPGHIPLDATHTFPFEDAAFDYVFSEHMIEHVSREAGLFMLCECFRVLKPGGGIRIATPDLAVLLALYSGGPQNPTAERYIRWITDTFLPDTTQYLPALVINNAFRNWGHQFLYDGELLELSLREAGFTECRRVSMGESEDPHLRGLESHGEDIGDQELAEFETMVFEARKSR